MSCSSKLSNPRWRSWEPWFTASWSEAQVTTWVLQFGIWSRVNLSFLTFYFILEYMGLTMWVSGGQQRASAICIHVSILSQLPSRPGCHITLNKVPVLCSRFLLVIHFKDGSVYMSIPSSEVGSILWDWTLNVRDLILSQNWVEFQDTQLILENWLMWGKKYLHFCTQMGFPGGSVVKNLHAKQETQVQSLGQEDPLEEEMTTHSSILAWEISWTEEPGGLQSMRSQKSWTWLRN